MGLKPAAQTGRRGVPVRQGGVPLFPENEILGEDRAGSLPSLHPSPPKTLLTSALSGSSETPTSVTSGQLSPFPKE